MYITKTTVMKTITQGFLFSFQGGGKWSTPEGGGYNGVDSASGGLGENVLTVGKIL